MSMSVRNTGSVMETEEHQAEKSLRKVLLIEVGVEMKVRENKGREARGE